jgi:hypothetical protein
MDDELRDLAIRVLIACIAVTWLVVLWRADRDPGLKNFRFLDLVTTKDGHIDRVAFMELGTWVIFSLIVVLLSMRNKFTENFAFIYVGFPAVRAGLITFQKMLTPAPPPATEGTVTTKDTTDTTKTVTRTVEPPAKGKGK